MMRAARALGMLSLLAIVLVTTATAATEARGTRSDPYPRGVMYSIPSSDGWRVRVDGSIPNANRLIERENQFNDPPPRGRQFFIIKVTIKYAGRGSSTAFEGLTLKALGRSSVAYDYSDDCGVTPNELDTTKKVYSGGVQRGNVCFAVKKTDLSSLLLLVEPGFSFEDVEKFFRVR